MKVTTGYIETRLKDYKEKSSTIQTTLARIKAYEIALENPKSYTMINFNTQSDMGTIQGKGGVPTSPVEQELLRKEQDQSSTIETLKEWIEEDKSRIYPLQVEIDQINGALNALTSQQRHIIECKYFDNMMWRDIEISLNEKFRQQNFITDRGIQKINAKSLQMITNILEIFYKRSSVS